MLIFEYKCQNCLSIFDHAILNGEKPTCINCKSENLKKNIDLIYKPNKVFCMKNKKDKSFNTNWKTKLAPTLQYDIGECNSCTLNQE